MEYDSPPGTTLNTAVEVPSHNGPLRIGQVFDVTCENGEVEFRAPLYLKVGDRLFVVFPAVAWNNDKKKICEIREASPAKYTAVVGYCDHVLIKGNVALFPLEKNIPESRIANTVTIENLELVPKVGKKMSKLLLEASEFLLHQDYHCEVIRPHGGLPAQLHRDKETGLPQCIAIPITDDLARTLQPRDIGALITTLKPERACYIPACGIFLGVRYISKKGPCCLVTPLNIVIQEIQQLFKNQRLRILLPVVQDTARNVAGGKVAGSAPQLPQDMALDLKHLFGDIEEQDTGYATAIHRDSNG